MKKKGKGKRKKSKGKKKKNGASPFRTGLLVLLILLVGAVAWGRVGSEHSAESELPSKATVDGIWLRLTPSNVESLLGPPDRVDDRNLPHLLVYEYDFPEEEKNDPELAKMVDSEHLAFKTKITFRDDHVLEVIGRDLVLPDQSEAHFLQTKKELMPLFDTSSRPGGIYWVGGITEHDVRATFYKKRLLWFKLRDRHR